MTVLIITHSQDNKSILMVSRAIQERGGKVFRFDSDRFPTEVQLEASMLHGTERLILSDGRDQVDLRDVTAVWYRRIATGRDIPTAMETQLRHASIQESRITVQGMIASIDAFHLDCYASVQRAKNKQLQLQMAQRYGLRTPRTLITNRPEAVRQFVQACEGPVITKMMASFAVYEQGQEQVVFTNQVTPDDLTDLDGLRYCPMTFQEEIPKALELRVTIVGQRVFAAAVDSQRLPGARYDWRRKGVALVRAWQPYDLPQDIADKLRQLMAYFGLHYGAIDVIVTPQGEYVFLEINPVGEFFWLELYSEQPISQALAETLLTQGRGHASARPSLAHIA